MIIMVQDSYDVIIIGGGPAGSTVARYSAEGGNVLVIDGRSHLPSNGELVLQMTR